MQCLPVLAAVVGLLRSRTQLSLTKYATLYYSHYLELRMTAVKTGAVGSTKVMKNYTIWLPTYEFSLLILTTMGISRMKALNLEWDAQGVEGVGNGQNFFVGQVTEGLTPTDPLLTTALSTVTAVIHVLVHDICVQECPSLGLARSLECGWLYQALCWRCCGPGPWLWNK